MANEQKNIVYDQWLARILHREVYRLVINDDSAKKAKSEVSGEYDWLRELQSRGVFIYAKVSTDTLSAVRFLEERGFNLIDTNVVFEKPIVPTHNLSGHCTVRFALPPDENQVVELARRGFIHSRFHLDSAFPREVADMIKAEWVKSYFTGNRGDTMVVALVDDMIVGFLLLLYEQDKILVIDLITVDEKYRRRRVAEDMIAFAESQCHGFTQIRVGTQLANVPSLGLYEGMGFKLAEAQYTFHYHHG